MRKAFRPLLLPLLLALLLLWSLPALAADVTGQVKEYLREFYVDPVDPANLQGETPEEIVQKLGDPYTDYFTPGEWKEFNQSLEGSFSGVGMTVEKRSESDYVEVLAPLPGTPAEKAGVKSGDRILAVNGEDMRGKDSDYVAGKIRGEPGTAVLLTLGREGQAEPVVLSIVRAVIELPVVEARMLEQGLGYVKVTNFSSDAADRLQREAKKLIQAGARGLIVDLRHNPGGYLEAGLAMADYLVPGEAMLVQIVSRGGEKEVAYAEPGSVEVPFVLLVDGASASASEIVAAAVQDNQAGLLVGERTFGKGSVQTILPLADGGALKVTTARYLSPKGHEINGVGVTPDRVVKAGEGGEDAQLQAAVAAALLVQLPAPPGDKAPAPAAEPPAAPPPPAPEPPALPRELWLQPGAKAAWLDGREIPLDVPAYLRQGRVMVPVRLAAQVFGARVEWDKAAGAVRVTAQGFTVTLFPGKATAQVGDLPVPLGAPAELVGGRVFIPLRAVAETLGASVSWDAASGRVRVAR